MSHVSPPSIDRQQRLQQFVVRHTGIDRPQLAVASADASFRSYWRLTSAGETRIIMDSPPDKEPVQPWLDIAERLRGAGLHSPRVYAADEAEGFLLLEDFGNRTYLAELNACSADALYAPALDALQVMQTQVATDGLPRYDHARLAAEMDYLPEWFLQRHLGCDVPPAHSRTIADAFAAIVQTVTDQPQRFVHRDYHSRNLMITAEHSPGIIDFQGAMLGPLTYDLVSLLRDCYIAWPADRVDAWVEAYRMRLHRDGVTDADAAHFRRWFDFTGLQRHSKVLGLFCRLCYRDGKRQYLADLPLVLRYTIDIAARYDVLRDFAALLLRCVDGRRLDLIREPAAADA